MQLGIRKRLILLTLAASVPLAGFAATMSYRAVDREYKLVQQQVFERVRLLSEAVDQAISDLQGNLTALAVSPLIRSGNWAAFHEHAVEVNRLSGGTAVLLVDRAGEELVNTSRQPASDRAKRIHLQTQELVFRTGEPQVSDLIVGPDGEQPVISVEVPVQSGGELKFVLAIEITPDFIGQVLQDQRFAAGWRSSIVDRNGVFVARLPDPGGFAGRPAGRTLSARVAQSSTDERWAKSVTADDVPVYGTYWRSARTSWVAAIGVPQTAADAPYILLVGWVVIGGIIVVGLSVILAMVAARLIIAPISALQRSVSSVGQGGSLPQSSTGIPEIDGVHQALRLAAERRQKAEDALKAERFLLESVIRHTPVGVAVAEAPSGRFFFANEEIKRLWNRDFADVHELMEHQRDKRFHPDGQPYQPETLPIARTLKQGISVLNEEISYDDPGTGERKTMVVNSAPVRDADGALVAAILAIYDITERTRAMERQETLLNEINHRTKNAMAKIQSIARLSSKTVKSPEEFISAFEARLVALSSAYDLLTQSRWQGANLREVLRSTLAPHLQEDRIVLRGQPVHLTPRICLSLTTAVYELATNSVKYGALSAAGGQVEIAWQVEAVGGEASVDLSWQEKGGPAVSPPARPGFGTRLLEQILPRELNGQVALEFLGPGLRCRIRFPLEPVAGVRAGPQWRGTAVA